MNGNKGGRSTPTKQATASVKTRSTNTSPGRFALKIFLSALAIVFSMLFLAASAGAGLVGGGAYGMIKTTPMLDAKVFKTMGFNSYLYDSEGNIIAELKKEENRVWIDYEDISQMLIESYVSVEDKRFFDHEGIDFKRIGSAVVSYAKKMLGADVDIQGGSTITQQLIKNLTKRDQITIPRKLQEQWQAMELEKVLTKKEIITHYLNNVPMGGNFYGIETASKGYFGKDVRDLSLAECASLAGITNWPTKYMPIDEENIEANIARTKMILGLMLEQGKISQSEYDEAVKEAEDIDFNYNPEAGKVMKTSNQSYFVDEAIKSTKEYLIKTYGYTDQAALDIIYNSGLHIYTTMDPKVQTTLDQVFTDPQYFSAENRYTDEVPQAAMVIMDKDGYVRGIYGGQGSKEGSVFNRATQAKRSPGSSIKPLVVYGPGIDSKTITAATVVDDVKQYLLNDKPNQEWPRNVENKNYGLTTVRSGLLHSRNVVATLVLKNHVGVDNGLNYLAKMGLNRKNEKYLSIAMGGFSEGMTPLEMTAAFTTYSNKGVYTKPMFFTEVKDNEGKVILDNKPERTQVFSEQTVFIMNTILEDVVKRGTAYPYGIVKYKDTNGKTVTIPSAGKTGTTDSNKDKWFSGFTPYYTAATWYGYDKAVALETSERNIALTIWNVVMNKIHEGMPTTTFFEKAPSNIVKRTICIDSGKIATDLCKSDPRGGRTKEEYFIEGTEPTYSDTCKVHVSALICSAAKDARGRYLLANEYCPAGVAKNWVGLRRPVEYKPKFPNDSYPLDYSYEIAEGEYCTIHAPSIFMPSIPYGHEDEDKEKGKDKGKDKDEQEKEEKSEFGQLLNPQNEDIGEPIQEEDWGSVDWGDDADAWD